MMNSSLSRLGLLGAILLAVGLAIGWTLPALAAGDPNEVVSHRVPQAMTAVLSYWTPQRMAAAKPMPLPRIPGGQVPATRSAPAAPTGPMVLAYPGGPGDTPREERIPQSELSIQEPVPQTGTYPFAFTSYQAFPNVSLLYKQYPWRVVGKVFFTIPGQGNFVCSGSVVNAPNNSLVWTAGHCVFSPGIGFHTNFVFVPARFNGTDPFATFAANTLGTLNGWMAGMFEFDHGAAAMERGGPAPGNHRVAELGFLGFLANAPRKQHFHATGYPAAPPFDGEHQQFCAAPWAADDPLSGGPLDPQTIGIGCDMTGGSSGGPWIVDYGGSTTTGNLINGNTSYVYIPPLLDPNELYSPYFGDGAVNLRDGIGAVVIP